MPQIRPITDLRNTNEIQIFVTLSENRCLSQKMGMVISL